MRLEFVKPLSLPAAAGALALLSSAASAQEAAPRDFCADRPGKGTPSCVLDQGRWQVELGAFNLARQTSDDERSQSWNTGDLFVRYGATGLTEIQFGITAYTHETVQDRATGDRQSSDGVSDITLGVRHSLANPDGSGLSVAVAGFVTAPTGSRNLRADGFEGGVLLPVSTPLNADWGLSLTPAITVVSNGDGQGRHLAYSMVAGVGRGVGAWDLGVELWVSRDDDPLQPTTQSTFDLTAVWTPPGSVDSQVDLGLNFGLNDDSPDLEFGVGLARRF
ncbi:hypothetical protein D3C72_842720 [compost metagenome]